MSVKLCSLLIFKVSYPGVNLIFKCSLSKLNWSMYLIFVFIIKLLIFIRMFVMPFCLQAGIECWQDGLEIESISLEIFRVTLSARRWSRPGLNLQLRQRRQSRTQSGFQSHTAVRKLHRDGATTSTATTAATSKPLQGLIL